jgi:hypothetical protein
MPDKKPSESIASLENRLEKLRELSRKNMETTAKAVELMSKFKL